MKRPLKQLKRPLKQLILTVCTWLLLVNVHFAAADTASDTEKLLNWAENTYPQYFPSHQVTQSIDPWLYRFYAETEIYAGVNKNDNSVYVLGGPWGDTPTRIAALSELVAQIPGSSIPACNTVNVPAGLVYTQSGNVVNVTTNGQCIPLPTTNNLCEAPQQSSATGISVLTTTNVNSSSIGGITIDMPGIPNPFQSFANNFSNSKHCTMNAPAETASLIINSDVCYDITTVFGDQYQDIPGVTITPPITMALKDTVTSQQVPDCFATDAATIYDAFTNEVWINQNGSFVKQ